MGGPLTTIERLESRIQFAGGTIDTTFGSDGAATFDYKPPLGSGTWSLGDGGFTQDSLGRIYGFTAASSGDTARRLVIARLTRDGQIDTSFAENGYRVLERNLATLNTTDHPQVAVDALNRSYILDGNVLWRLTPGGKLDRTFNVKAKVVMTSMTKYEDLTTDANGLVYVGGTSQGKTGTRMTVVRFTELGAADTSYGFEGAYKSPVPGKAGDKSRASSSKLIQFVGDDLMVAGTYTYSRYDAEYPGYFAHNATWTVRLDASGNVDSSYGTNGYAEQDYVNSDVAWGSARPTTIAPDGTVFGATTGGTDYPDGDPASFGSNFKISSDGQAVQSVNIATGQQDTDFDLESVTSPVAV